MGGCGPTPLLRVLGGASVAQQGNSMRKLLHRLVEGRERHFSGLIINTIAGILAPMASLIRHPMSSAAPARVLPSNAMYDLLRGRPRAQALWAVYGVSGRLDATYTRPTWSTCPKEVARGFPLTRDQAEAEFSQDLRYMWYYMTGPGYVENTLNLDALRSAGTIAADCTAADVLERVLEECAAKWPTEVTDAEVDTYYATDAVAIAEAFELKALKAAVAAATSRDAIRALVV